MCRPRFARRHYLPRRGIAEQCRTPVVGRIREGLGSSFSFFSGTTSAFLPAHKPPTSFPQAHNSVMLRIYRDMCLWKTCGCLCTAKKPSFCSSHTCRPSRPTAVLSAVPEKKPVRSGYSHTCRPSRPTAVLIAHFSLETRPETLPNPTDHRRAALLRNAAPG